MTKTLKKLWQFLLLATLLVVSVVACGKQSDQMADNMAEKVTIMLDWTPNTNHTGLFVAEELGYFKDAGIDVEIQNLPDDSSASDIVANNQAQFGIYFQEYMAKKLVKGAPLTAVAAILEHNTSGILVKDGITSVSDLADKTYGTWADPLELAMLEKMTGSDVYGKIKQVNNDAADSVSGIENGLFDAAWIYYGWDGILAEEKGAKTNFFYATDLNSEFDFYSPIIIANNDYLAANKEQAKKVVQAIKKGYQYAIENPDKAADILMKHAPELADQKEFIYASQKYLSEHYASDKAKWGEIAPERWNQFYTWVNGLDLFEGKMLEKDQGFTNELIVE